MKYLIVIALFGLTLAAQTVSPPSGGGGSGSSCSGDINSGCSQVTGTHLASPLPVGQGGTGLAAGTAGKVLGGATPSMVTVTSAYVDNSIALTGTDINTSNQVTVTHLASALPVTQGGTGLASTTANQLLYSSTTSTIAGLSTGNGGVLSTNSSGVPSITQAPALGTDNSVAGTLQLANGSSNAHTIWSSGATTTNTIAGFTVVPTTGDLVSCTAASTTCTLTDSGVLAANVVKASSPGAGIAHFAGSTQTVTSSAVSLTADVSGVLPLANGGTNANLTAAVGSLPYSSSSAIALLAGNTAATDEVLTSTGTGSAAQAPSLKNAPALSGANFTAATWSTLQTFGTNISIGAVTATGATGTGNVVFSAAPALTGNATAATQSACSGNTLIATALNAHETCTTVETSGSPLSITVSENSVFWNNTASAYVFDLPAPPSTGSAKICIGQYGTRTGAISFVPPSGVTIYYKGIAGTAGSSTGIVSGGAAGDYLCLYGVNATTYLVEPPGFGTWTNN